MVHNGIEYGLMQSYAEGYELLAAAEQVDNVTEVWRSWREGTVIRSWLLDLLVAASDEDPGLAQIQGYAEDSGEGRWTIQAAIENAVPMHAITAALYTRFQSRQDDSPAMKAVAAMRNQFGGHAVKAGPPPTPGLALLPPQEKEARAARAPRSSVAGRLPVVRDGRGAARAGCHGVHRAERPGQDQPRRGGPLLSRPRARTGSRPTRPW